MGDHKQRAVRFAARQPAILSGGKGSGFGWFFRLGWVYMDADRLVATDPAANAAFKTARDDDRPRAFPILRSPSSIQFVDRNNGVWILDGNVRRFTLHETLYHAIRNPNPPDTDVFDLHVYHTATLVDREDNIWLGGPDGLYRFFYTPLMKVEIPRARGTVCHCPRGSRWNVDRIEKFPSLSCFRWNGAFGRKIRYLDVDLCIPGA